MTDNQKITTDEDQQEVRLDEYKRCGEVRPGTLGYQRCQRPTGHSWMHMSQDHEEWTPIADLEQLSTADLRRWIEEARSERDICGRLVARAVLCNEEPAPVHVRAFGVAEAEVERLSAEDKRRRG